jgi:hypothetical protein
MLQAVIALCLFINGQLVEHRIQDSIAECLKHKSAAERNECLLDNKSLGVEKWKQQWSIIRMDLLQ